MFTTKTLLPCVAVASSAFVSSAALAQTVAVQFGGDMASGNRNSSLDDGSELQVDFADFNGDTLNDARTFIPIDHNGVFLTTSQFDNADPATTSTVWRAGMQIVNNSSAAPVAAPSDVQLFRLNDRGASPDTLQMSTTAQAGGALTQGMVFAPHVSKDAFLNGLSGATELSFANVADSFDLSYFWGTNVVASTPPQDVQLRRGRLMVQDGAQWYISESRVGSKGTSGTPNNISINPATEMWFPIDLSGDFYYTEVGGGDTTPNSANIGAPVLGSSFTDIQALGAHLVLNNFDGAATNNGIVEILDISASLDAVFPPPPAPPVGETIVNWQMDTTSVESLIDPFSAGTAGEFSWGGAAVPDAAGGNDPLFLGDPNQPPTIPNATFDTANAPKLTVGGQGVTGEALRFNANEEDEAIGIVAWQGDSSDPFVTEDLDSVYIDFYFQEDSNTTGNIQMLLRGRNAFQVWIDGDGDLIFRTQLAAGGADIIEVDLDAPGAWRHVQAWHDANGDKVLMLDGQVVAQSSPGTLFPETGSIILGNRENDSQWFSGLIDNVIVGTGVPSAAFLEADFNEDGTVDLLDFDILAQNFGTVGGATTATGDANGDGDVDLLDFDVLAQQFGQSSPAAVPEPASLALLGLGGAALLRRRRL